MVRSSLCVCALLLLACGGGTPTPESTPIAESTPSLVQVKAEPASPAAMKPPPKKKSGTDPLAQTLALPAGDLHVVFTNNLDGDIDPCG